MCQISFESVQGFWFCRGSNFGLSHRNAVSPLTQGLNYRSACDTNWTWNSIDRNMSAHGVCSVLNLRLHFVLLEPTVLPGMVQRQSVGWSRDLRYNGTYFRVVEWRCGRVQGGCRRVRLEAHRAVIWRWYFVELLVRGKTVQRLVLQQRQLHVYVDQAWLRSHRQRARRLLAASSSTHARWLYNSLLWLPSE